MEKIDKLEEMMVKHMVSLEDKDVIQIKTRTRSPSKTKKTKARKKINKDDYF